MSKVDRLKLRESLTLVSLLSVVALSMLGGCTLNSCPDDAVLYGKLNKETICYLDGKVKHGTHMKWYPSGEHEMFERTYSKDTLNGPYREWYSNGQLKIEANYNNGKLDGMYLKWYSNGQKRLISRYDKNVRVGTYTEFFKNGKPHLEYLFNPLGQPEGKQTRYRMNGFPISEYTYYLGKLVGKRFWRNNGMLEPVLSQK